MGNRPSRRHKEPPRSPGPAHSRPRPNPHTAAASSTYSDRPSSIPRPIASNVGRVLGRPMEDVRASYTFGRELGRGQFGITNLVTHRETGQQFACKSIAARKLIRQDDLEDVRRDIQIMHHLTGHRNIVELKGVHDGRNSVNLVMELCEGGELFDRIIAKGHYSERAGVMHQDLKPENFLFLNKKEDSPLKATDFGLSVFFKPENEDGIFDAILLGHIDFSSDPWSSISNGAKELVKKMLRQDPKERFTAAEILNHAWMKGDGAPDKPLDLTVLNRMKQFWATNKLKKVALKVIAKSLSEDKIIGLKEIFKLIDTDNSGTITFEELKSGLPKLGNLGIKISEPEVRQLIEAADVDGNGTIDYIEFITATMHMNRMEKEDHLYKAFEYFDEDKSGYITVEELEQALKYNMGDEKTIKEIIAEVDIDKMEESIMKSL